MVKDVMTLYGKNSVFERLKANPGSIKKIFLQDSFNAAHIEKAIKENNVLVERVSSKELARIRHAKDLQGIVAKVDNFNYLPFDDLLRKAKEEKLVLIFLDRIYDPQNLGSILRTAACFGGFAVIISKFKACEVNETVLHVASGAENYIPVSMAPNLSNALTAAKEAGYWIMGTVVGEDAGNINEISLPFPLGFVLGSEGEGIRQGVRKHLDLKARIPMEGAELSFNVTMACAVFCYEISRQRRGET